MTMQTFSSPFTAHHGPVLSNVGQLQRTLCRGCGRVFGTSAEENRARTTNCPHCQVQLSLGDAIGGTVPGTPIASYGRTVPPPPPPHLIAPPVQMQMEERTGVADHSISGGSRFPLALAVFGGVGVITVLGLILAAVLTLFLWQRAAAMPEKEDLVTEIQLSDAERSQTELERTKAANRQVQTDIQKLESEARTLENELVQLRKSVL